MKNNESVYDKEIYPLMQKIIEICKRENIPMFSDFHIADNLFSTTCIYPEIENRHVIISLYNMLSKCKELDGINLDKFIFSISKNYDNKSSIVLYMLGNNPTLK